MNLAVIPKSKLQLQNSIMAMSLDPKIGEFHLRADICDNFLLDTSKLLASEHLGQVLRTCQGEGTPAKPNKITFPWSATELVTLLGINVHSGGRLRLDSER